MARAQPLALILLVVVVGCTKAPESSPLVPATLDQLEKALETIEQVPERAPTFLVEAIAESSMLGKECSTLLDDSLTANPADRAAVIARAHRVCKMTCPSPKLFAGLRDLRPTDWDRAIDADCNRGGPDPIFGTDADARRRSGLDAYFRTRFVVQASMARLTSDGSPRAKLLAARIGALVPALARALPVSASVAPSVGEVAPPEVKPHDAEKLTASGDDPDGPQAGGDLNAQIVKMRENIDGAEPTANGSAASRPAGRITVASKRALVDSTLTADVLLLKIQSTYMAGLKRCYKQRLAADPAAKGSVQIRLGVEATGRTTEILVTSFHPDHESCAKGLIQNWRFPVAKGPDGEPVVAAFELTLDHAAE